MKVLFFIESFRSGGKERRLVELLKEMAKDSKFAIKVVLIKNEIHYEELKRLNLDISIIERKFFKKDPQLFIKFFRIVRSFKPDIINVWGNMPAFYAIPSKVLLKIPMINSQITDAPDVVSSSFIGPKTNFKFSDVILANSKAGIKAYNSPKEKSRVIYNGLDLKRTEIKETKETIKQKFKIDTPFVVGMTASFSDKKDQPTLVKAGIEILQKRKDVTFLFIGDGDTMESVKQLVPESLKKYFKFLGKQQQVETIVNVFDIGVLTTFTEGISNSIMEYMVMSKPVIATDGGATNEILIDKKTGYLVDRSDYKDVAEKIIWLLDSPAQAQKMGTEGRKRIINDFSISKMVTDTIQVYKEFS